MQLVEFLREPNIVMSLWTLVRTWLLGLRNTRNLPKKIIIAHCREKIFFLSLVSLFLGGIAAFVPLVKVLRRLLWFVRAHPSSRKNRKEERRESPKRESQNRKAENNNSAAEKRKSPFAARRGRPVTLLGLLDLGSSD